ncbi:MAG: TetR/AcrR family transcriptional regulator [Bacteroidota bacterium]
MSKTKEKIVIATIQLFNEHGFANVSLPQIADKLSISLGNLTYHFPKKEQLINAIYVYFQEELAAITNNYDYATALEITEIDRRLRAFYAFQQRFHFFYLDLLELERAYPKLAIKHQKHIEEQIEGIYKSFQYNVSAGNLIASHSENIYRNLAQQFWLCTVFWPLQMAVRGKDSSVEAMTTATWLLVSPYATEKGKKQLEILSQNKNNKSKEVL